MVGKHSVQGYLVRLALGVAFWAAGLAAPLASAHAQQMPDVITPPEVTADPNGLNLETGKVAVQRPEISIPAAPRLTYSQASDFLMYASAQVTEREIASSFALAVRVSDCSPPDGRAETPQNCARSG